MTDVRKRIASARGFIFDMDGTLALGDKASGGHRPLAGAVDLIATLRRRGTPFRVFTNGSAKAPHLYAASLRKAGFDVADEEMMTPSTVAAAWFAGRGLKRVRVLGDPGVEQPLVAAGLDVVEATAPTDGVQAVYSAWYRGFGFDALELACRDIWAGASLATASHVPFFAAAGGRAIGSSYAINAMLKSLTNKRATIVGKPSSVSFHHAVRAMGLLRSAAPEIVVVGDDAALETRMANAAGAVSVGVATGLNSLDYWRALPDRDRPLLAVEKAADLISILG